MASFMLPSAFEDIEFEQRRKRRRLEIERDVEDSEFAGVAGYNLSYHDERIEDGNSGYSPRGWMNDDASEVVVESAAVAAQRQQQQGDPASADGGAAPAPAAAAAGGGAPGGLAYGNMSVGKFVPLSEIEEQVRLRNDDMFSQSAWGPDGDLCYSSCSEDEEVQRYEAEDVARMGRGTAPAASESSVPPDIAALDRLFAEHTEESSAPPEAAPPAVVARAGNKRRADECFRCMHGDRNYDALYAKQVHQLVQLMESNVGHVELRCLARQVHQFFKHNIYLPARRAGKRVRMWRSRSVYEHLTQHDMDPRLFLVSEMRVLRSNLDQLKHMLYERNAESGAVEVSFKAQKLRLETLSKLMLLYTKDPKQLNFYDDAAQYDPAARTKHAMESALGSYKVTTREVSSVYQRRAV